MYAIRIAVLLLVWCAPALEAQSSSCRRGPGSTTADSTKSIPAEDRLIGPNPLSALPRPDSAAGAIRVNFIVASNGRVAPWTVHVSGTENRRWIVRARGVLARSRFAPVVRNHCGVPQWMHLTYAPRS